MSDNWVVQNLENALETWNEKLAEIWTLIFSVCACVVAVGLYFLLKPYVGTETVSWMCVLGAAPFAALGFVKYNGMTAEKFIWAFIKSEFLMPKRLVFHSTNTYYEMMKPNIEQKQKEVLKSND